MVAGIGTGCFERVFVGFADAAGRLAGAAAFVDPGRRGGMFSGLVLTGLATALVDKRAASATLSVDPSAECCSV